MTRPFAIALAVALATSAVACTSERFTYAPVRTTSADVAGESGAVVRIPRDAPRGDVRVVTFGIAPLQPEDDPLATVRALHVSLVVSNRSDETWTILGDEQRVSLGGTGSPIVARSARVAAITRMEIPARSTRWIDLFFPLPQGVETPGAIPSFDVTWTVRTGARPPVVERTTFERFVIGAPPKMLETNPPRAVPAPSAPRQVGPE